MPEYRLRPKARADLDGIWDYTYTTWGAKQARHYLTDLKRTCAKLACNPHLGKLRTDAYEGLRVYPAGKHLVFYLAIDVGIDVVRVLHERMDAQSHLVPPK